MSTRSEAVVPELPPGSTFAGYRIEALAGRGAMGVVYRAVHPTLKRPLALKLIAPRYAQNPSFRARFQREWPLAASIDHPNVVRVENAGEHDGLLFVAVTFVEGSDLRAILAQKGRIHYTRAAHIVAQIASALDAAHHVGLVHRDVKPAHILVGGADHAYLTDFGLGNGTADFAAPEQVVGWRVDARSDVYSLGCVLFTALTGRVAFPREGAAPEPRAHIQDPIPSVTKVAPDVPPEFAAVIRGALAKEPSLRYPSAGDLGRAVIAASQNAQLSAGRQAPVAAPAAPPPPAPPALAPPSPAPPPQRRPGIRRPLLVGGLIVGLIAAAALLFASSGGEDAPDAESEIRDRVEAFAGADTPAGNCASFSQDYLRDLGGTSGCRGLYRDLEVSSIEVDSVEVDGGEATAAGSYSETGDAVSLTLEEADGEWLISGVISPESLVRNAVLDYAASEGSEACAFLSTGFIDRNFEGIGCRQALSGSDAVDVEVERVEVNGDDSAQVDARFDGDGDGNLEATRFTLVAEPDAEREDQVEWLIDSVEETGPPVDVDTRAIARELTRRLEENSADQVTVDCPNNVDNGRGTKFTCSVTGTLTGEVRVRQSNDRGTEHKYAGRMEGLGFTVTVKGQIDTG